MILTNTDDGNFLNAAHESGTPADLLKERLQEGCDGFRCTDSINNLEEERS